MRLDQRFTNLKMLHKSKAIMLPRAFKQRISALSNSGTTLRGGVARGAIGSFGLQVIEAGLGFLTSIVLARALGVAEYGIYAFAIAFAGFLTFPALLGHDSLSVKQCSKLAAVQAWPRLRAFLNGARRRVLFSSLIVTASGFAFLLVARSSLTPGIQDAARISLVMVPVVALLRLHEGFLRGIGRVTTAQFPDKALRPGLFLAVALAANLYFEDFRLGAEAVLLNLVATTLGFFAVLGLWYRYRPEQVLHAPADPEGDKGIRQALPFALLAGLSVINTQTDVLMLGFLGTPEDVGFYRIASRVSSLVAFALTAVAATLAPRVAALHATGSRSEMQNLASKAALATTAFALPMALVLVFGGNWVLFLFGEEFQRGATALAILSFGQLINATAGAAGVFLTMTGHHALVARTLTFSALLNIALNAALIPSFGASGAAIATATTYLTWNVALVFLVKSELRINTTVFNSPRRNPPPR